MLAHQQGPWELFFVACCCSFVARDTRKQPKEWREQMQVMFILSKLLISFPARDTLQRQRCKINVKFIRRVEPCRFQSCCQYVCFIIMLGEYNCPKIWMMSQFFPSNFGSVRAVQIEFHVHGKNETNTVNVHTTLSQAHPVQQGSPALQQGLGRVYCSADCLHSFDAHVVECV